MITSIQLKQVIRNKRFLMFTVFLPVCWLFIISNLQNVLSPNVVFGIAVFIGIIGNGIATFSKRISSEKEFFIFQSKVSNYSMKNYFFNQTLVQLCLNSGIFLVVAAFAILFFNLTVSWNLLVQFILLMIMGVYFSCIGFLIGSRVSPKIIDTVSFPIIIIASLTIVPFSQFATSNLFLKIVSAVQKIFPGYYYNEGLSDLINNSTVNLPIILLFFMVFLLNLIPIYLLIPSDNYKK